jgi:hypothetical protein
MKKLVVSVQHLLLNQTKTVQFMVMALGQVAVAFVVDSYILRKTNMWKLFLDDYRSPEQVGFNSNEFFIARSYDEAVKLCEEMGCPQHVCFDHDLSDEHYHGVWGKNPTGKDFANWLTFKDMEARFKFIPDDFTYSVHSMNPAGAENIDKLMSSYLCYRNEELCGISKP